MASRTKPMLFHADRQEPRSFFIWDTNLAMGDVAVLMAGGP
ncbi:hypothetical protein [Nitrospira defluvii]|nr:hypothetical protein [Nitrospira defluvii]